MKRKNSPNCYYTYRIRLEKLKQETWQLIVIARVLLFLAAIVHHFW